MANQGDKRQQFRFWYPFWRNPSTTPSRPPASAPRPSPTKQPKPRATTQAPAPSTPPIKKTNSRTPSLSPSPSSSSSSSSPSPSPSSSQAKQNQPKRVSRIPSLPLPSPTQSPSRRSSRLDQVKQKTKDIDAETSLEASNQQGTKQEEQLFDKEPIEPKAQDPKTIDDKPTSQSSNINSNSNVEKENAPKDLEKNEARSISFDPLISDKEPIQQKEQSAEAIDDKPTSQASNNNVEKENGSKDLEKIEPKLIPFDPLNSDKSKPTETVIPDKKPSETDEQKVPQNHEPKPQLELDKDREENEIIKHETSEQVPKTEVSETQLEENKQTGNETHQDKSIHDMNHQENEITKDNNSEETETIKEIAKPIHEGDPKETIKDTTQPSTSDVHHLDSNNQSKTNNSVNNNNNNHSDNEDRAAKRKETRTSFHKDIKGGISKLIQKINADNQLNPGSDSGTSIITLAGENKGASMYIGDQENEGQTSTFTGRACNEKDEIEIVNSNVQSINNSVLRESKCDTRDPGVHLRFSTRMKKEKMKNREAIR